MFLCHHNKEYVHLLYRQKKRKTEEPHDEEHAEFDAKALREHEEYTKVLSAQLAIADLCTVCTFSALMLSPYTRAWAAASLCKYNVRWRGRKCMSINR
jgi:hypothetical protein